MFRKDGKTSQIWWNSLFYYGIVTKSLLQPFSDTILKPKYCVTTHILTWDIDNQIEQQMILNDKIWIKFE